MLPKMLSPQQESIANGALNHFVACDMEVWASFQECVMILEKDPTKECC